MNCPKCQVDIPDGSRFCSTCGFDISSSDLLAEPEAGVDATPTTLGQRVRSAPDDADPRSARRSGIDATPTLLPDGHVDRGSVASVRLISARYEILEFRGEGGMGRVYRARDTRLNIDVALKRLSTDMKESELGVKRFLREAQTIARLNHQNIVRVSDIDEDTEGHYIVMEWIGGADLAELIRETGGLELARALSLFRGICSAVSYAHRHSVIHRDIKPQNILLTEDGIPKLVDFGLARMGRESDLSLSGYGLGTLAYMAPEQQRDASRSDHRSDIFSLGKTLYHMVTGEVPYAVDAEATPEHMRAAITRALKPRPEDRYFSVDEFLDAVERAPQTGSLRPAPVASAVATVCSNCGLANSEDVRYCMGCGASLLVACSRCGRENRAGTRFCGGCGSSITRRGENPGRLETARDHVADNRQSSAVMETGVREFAGSDAVYQRWLAANPGGFVINMYRDMDPNHYSMLHRATCHTITACSGQARPGGLTERDFVKVCAGSIEDLRDWVRRHGRPNGTFKSECSKCRPK